MKKVIKFNIWDYLDIEEVNAVLDDVVEGGIAEDIGYRVKDIKANGDITLNAKFELYEMD